MSWIALALVCAGLFALVSMFDKTVLYRYARTPLTLPLLTGFAQTTIGLVVLAAVGIPDDATWKATGTALGSGVLFGLSGLLGMRVLFSQEVSRTIPVTQTAPIFAAVIALVFLDETISALQWVAILATVAGAALLSLRMEAGGGSVFLHRSFFPLILGAVIFGAANVIGKVALDDLPVMYTHAMRSLGLGSTFLLLNLRPAPLANVREFISQRSPALIFVSINELIIANGALVLLLWALSLGPVSLVTALVGTRAMFVVLYSTTLALVWKGALGEETSAGSIAVKAGSTSLIVAGIVGIAI